MTDYTINGCLHCADFIGGDQNISYGFTSKDVERLIEKVLAMIQAGEIFQPLPDQPNDALQIEHNCRKLTSHPGAIRHLSSQGQICGNLL